MRTFFGDSDLSHEVNSLREMDMIPDNIEVAHFAVLPISAVLVNEPGRKAFAYPSVLIWR